MYFVKLYDNEDNLIFNAPFEDREQAIKYFNTKLDQSMYFETVPFFNYKRAEICNDNFIIFDYEV